LGTYNSNYRSTYTGKWSNLPYSLRTYLDMHRNTKDSDKN